MVIILLFWEFFTPAPADGDPLEFDKSPQISRIHLSILVDLNSSVVWMVSIRVLISKSTSPFIKHLLSTKRTNYN